MAIDTITPVTSSLISHGDAVSFKVDDTYTSMVINVVTASSTESAYNSGSGGAQAGYTFSVINSGGRDTFTFSRDAGWDVSPQVIKVTEDETGTPATTTLSYELDVESTYPQGANPYNSIRTGILTVSEEDLVVRSDVGQLDFDGVTFNVTDLGSGKVSVEGVGGVKPLQALRIGCSVVTVSTHWRTHPQTTGFMAENWNFSSGVSSTDPAFARFNNAMYFDTGVTIEKVVVVGAEASPGTASIEVELWQVPLADGDTTSGTKTQMAGLTHTFTTTNRMYVLEMTITDPQVVAGSQVQLFIKSDEARTQKMNFTIYYREDAA